MISRLVKSTEAKNAGWLIAGRVIQLMITFVMGIFTTRYLGPGNYGLINYANVFVAFFTPVCTLGIQSVIIRDFVNHPGEEGKALGSSLVFRLISGFFSSIIIVVCVSITDSGETATIVIAAICSFQLVFRAFDLFHYWFQYKQKASVIAIVMLVAHIATSFYKAYLLVSKKSIYWFATAVPMDYLILAVMIYCVYKKNDGPELIFSRKKGFELLSYSYHFILSGMMVAVYAQTDKFMLKQMLDETSVGYYSLASSINMMWVFVLQAVIDAFYPAIMKLYSVDQNQFERKNRQLYATIEYISLFVAICFTIFGRSAVQMVYGEAYVPASDPLKVICWYTMFSYLGVARDAWIVCKGLQKYLKYMYLCAAVLNVILNLLLIPISGMNGAAVASLTTQIATSLIFPCFVKELRPNIKLIIEALFLIKTR